MTADSTIRFYDANAQTFFSATVDVDLTLIYQRFLSHIPTHSHILDAGCGSGRDAAFFHAHGYRVSAFDASPQLAALATAYTGLPVQVLRFEDITWHQEFDAVWACASLLHLSPQRLPDMMRRLHTALKQGGVLYASFKYGHGEAINDERYFHYLDEPTLTDLLIDVPGFTVLETWITSDQRPNRSHERWLNSLLRA